MKRSLFVAAVLLGSLVVVPAVAEAGGGGDDPHHAPPVNWLNLDYKQIDAHGHELTPGEHHMAPPLGLALMNFAVFFGLLAWKGGPPIASYVRGRHLSIKEALEEGKRLRDEAAKKLKEYSERIKGVEAEVDQLIADVRKSAEAEKARILDEAERQASQMKRNAEQQIAANVERARADLEREVMDAAIAAAETILRDKASASDHEKLVDGFLVDLQSVGQPGTEHSR